MNHGTNFIKEILCVIPRLRYSLIILLRCEKVILAAK
jgi:hypothetical protein